MRVRQLDTAHDWTFGKGRNNYLTANKAVGQNIDTRLNEFLGDCFFNLGAGIDWFSRLGSKDQVGLKLDISSVILNTQDVTGILTLDTFLSPSRQFSVSYSVQTVYSVLNGTLKFTQNIDEA